MTLNEYVAQNAAGPVMEELLLRFGGVEVFCKVEAPGQRLQSGPVTTSGDVQLRMRTVRLEVGHMALFYTSKNDLRLSRPFAGMPLVKAAQMVFSMPELDGLLLQSDSDAWFAVNKQAIRDAFK